MRGSVVTLILAIVALAIILIFVSRTYVPQNVEALCANACTLQDVVKYCINKTVLDRYAAVPISGKTQIDIMWNVLKWVDENLKYDIAKFKRKKFCTYKPLYILEKRRGVCVDYALATSLLLLTHGVDKVYILMLKEPSHAIVLVNINNIWYVLDQHLPPIEFEDYVQYVLRGNFKIYKVYELVRIDDKIEIRKVKFSIDKALRDTYPVDSMPNTVIMDVIDMLSMKVKARPDRHVAELANLRLASTFCMTLNVTLGLGHSFSTTSVFVLYSPALRQHFVNYLADKLLSIEKLRQALEHGRFFWVNVSRSRLCVYVTNYTWINVEKTCTDGVLEFSIPVRNVTDVLNNVRILILDARSRRPVAGVLPSGYKFENMHAVVADKWQVLDSILRVAVRIDKLREYLSGEYVLVVAVGQDRVHVLNMSLICR